MPTHQHQHARRSQCDKLATTPRGRGRCSGVSQRDGKGVGGEGGDTGVSDLAWPKRRRNM